MSINIFRHKRKSAVSPTAGKGDSGSQMLYALKIFYGADTQIPEDIALEAINDAIRINFPQKKGIFLGMYRKVINKEDSVSTKDRVTNQV